MAMEASRGDVQWQALSSDWGTPAKGLCLCGNLLAA